MQKTRCRAGGGQKARSKRSRRQRTEAVREKAMALTGWADLVSAGERKRASAQPLAGQGYRRRQARARRDPSR